MGLIAAFLALSHGLFFEPQGIPAFANGMVHARAASGPALISHVSAHSTDANSVTTTGITTTGANTLVAACSRANGGTAVVSDSKSNSWTELTKQTTPSVSIFYALNATVGASHTFTCSPGATTFPAIAVATFSGLLTSSAFNQQNGTSGGSGTTIQTGSVTPSNNNQLIIASVTFFTSSAPVSINSSFTISDTEDYTANSFGVSLAYLIQGTAGAVNPTWTFGTGAVGSAAVIGTFKSQ